MIKRLSNNKVVCTKCKRTANTNHLTRQDTGTELVKFVYRCPSCKEFTCYSINTLIDQADHLTQRYGIHILAIREMKDIADLDLRLIIQVKYLNDLDTCINTLVEAIKFYNLPLKVEPYRDTYCISIDEDFYDLIAVVYPGEEDENLSDKLANFIAYTDMVFLRLNELDKLELFISEVDTCE